MPTMKDRVDEAPKGGNGEYALYCISFLYIKWKKPVLVLLFIVTFNDEKKTKHIQMNSHNEHKSVWASRSNDKTTFKN